MTVGPQRVVDVAGLSNSRQWGYAHVVVAGDLIFVAGQAGQDEHGQIVSLDFEPQARRTFENIERALSAVGAGVSDLVAMTSFITDWRFAPVLSEVRKEMLGENLVTDALVGVEQLALPEMLIEVQSVAVRLRN
jgi:enamine deaminase RidA (YjgF/YER057c/UK114 family)